MRRATGRVVPAALLVLATALRHAAALAEGQSSLADLSLEQLSNLEVTSVSKSSELLRQAPASIYVITHDEIVRSGASTVSEALRLAPNLQLAQYTSNMSVAGARGMAGAHELQNFSNKLLILIDGRSVYSPLYSGVYLDVQDVVLDDVDRIEVISGPGATLWGANAMHGVINIITRPSWLTDGTLASAAWGNQERDATLRVGRRQSEHLAWRAYGKAFHRDGLELADGSDARDPWHKLQGGFRVDWTGNDDALTVQGDAYDGTLHEGGTGGPDMQGMNLLGRWQHHAPGRDFQLQAYYDRTERAQPPGGVAFVLDTFDLDLQQSLASGRHRFIWGAGARLHSYEITNSGPLAFIPPSRDLMLANVFAQDVLSLTARTDLTLGLKAERDGYSGWHLLPDLRVSRRIGADAVAWVAASRAIRSPTPFDREVVESPAGPVLLRGDPHFEPERVTALELGMRALPSETFTISAAAFVNRYAGLRNIEATPVTVLPLQWGNGMQGHSQGLEVWGSWLPFTWWRVSPGLRLVDKDLSFEAGAGRLGGLAQAGNDPRWQALLTSSMDLGLRWRLQATFRHVDDLPSPHLASYTELDASLGWRADQRLDIELTGRNLLHDRHAEYVPPAGEFLPRSVLLQLRWQPAR